MSGTEFDGSIIIETIIRETDLTDVAFVRSNISNSYFIASYLGIVR